MRLLPKKEIQQKRNDAEAKDFILAQQRRNRIKDEITLYNSELDDIKKAKELLEKEFDIFCQEMNEKRRFLLKDIKSLEDKKQELTDTITNLLNKIQ